MSPRAKRWLTLVLAVVTALVLVLSIPFALRDAYARGGIYLFSQEFLDDLPRRLSGPGRMRFVIQPVMASLLGFAAGRRDSRCGRPAFLLALLLGKSSRKELLKGALGDIGNIVLLGILLDALSQRIILGVVHPGVALLVGPFLVSGPYAIVRALTNRAITALDRRKAA